MPTCSSRPAAGSAGAERRGGGGAVPGAQERLRRREGLHQARVVRRHAVRRLGVRRLGEGEPHPGCGGGGGRVGLEGSAEVGGRREAGHAVVRVAAVRAARGAARGAAAPAAALGLGLLRLQALSAVLEPNLHRARRHAERLRDRLALVEVRQRLLLERLDEHGELLPGDLAALRLRLLGRRLLGGLWRELGGLGGGPRVGGRRGRAPRLRPVGGRRVRPLEPREHQSTFAHFAGDAHRSYHEMRFELRARDRRAVERGRAAERARRTAPQLLRVPGGGCGGHVRGSCGAAPRTRSALLLAAALARPAIRSAAAAADRARRLRPPPADPPPPEFPQA